jgi:hypothetical protein
MALSAYEFNSMAEKYYREELKNKQIDEGFQVLRRDLLKLDSWESWRSGKYNRPLWRILKGCGADEFLRNRKKEAINGEATAQVLKTFIHLMLLTIHQDIEQAQF